MESRGDKAELQLSSKGFFAFERLEVYQLSVKLAADIYTISREFPAEERFGLTNQIRRASTSVTLNIAEGSGRGSQKDFARFLMQARGSAYEVVAALHLARQLNYLSPEAVTPLCDEAHTLSAKLMAFIHKLTPP